MSDCDDLGCSRRRLLALAGVTAGVSALELATPAMAFGSGRATGDLLVVITLSGGADGLTLVPPLHDAGYLAARPEVGVRPSLAIPLDRHFGLHPGLKPLLPFWRSRQLAIVHAVGDADGTRSHFESIDAMERGVRVGSNVSTGWVDRHLAARGLTSATFPALTIGGRPSGSLAGPAPDLAAYDIRDVRVHAPREPVAERALQDMYAGLSGDVATAGRATLSAVRTFRRFRDTPVPKLGAYSDDGFGRSLQQIAQVAKARVGLEAACVTVGGWDMHEGMGNAAAGYAATHIAAFGKALAAFAHDLGPLLRTTTIVTVSEFGRRVAQNGSHGLDHGYGSAWFVLGGGINGGRVYGRWPGLGPTQLVDGDLRATTDYRDVLGELIHRRLGGGSLRTVFPDHQVHELGLARQR
jgi:uncharacterized protein (DUF1501 family)